MKIDARRLLMRVEMRLAQMCGQAMVADEGGRAGFLEQLKNDLWVIGLIEAWKQIRSLLETGHLAAAKKLMR